MIILGDNNTYDMEVMKIKYDGLTHQIDANTLINSLLHFTNIVHEVNRNLEDSRKIEIKINALDKGSFLVDLIIIASNIKEHVAGLFTSENLAYAANLATAVTGVYHLAQFLKGDKPKKIETVDNTVKIENNQGDVKYFDFRHANVYFKSPTLQEAVSQEFETLDKDESVTRFEILGSNNEVLVDIPSYEFKALSENDGDATVPDENIRSVEAMLKIVSLDWELKRKWSFLYEGNPISAKILDQSFAEQIDKGEPFRKGDTLKVKMDIKQVYDVSIDAYKNTGKYMITEIIEHLKRSDQPGLF